MRNRKNLDLLRSVAVVLVVLDHTLLAKDILHWHRWPIGDIGLFGVYLFFLHTSLVLMGSLERRPNTLDFYIRRAFRIYPLAVVAILIAAATHAPVAGTAYHYFLKTPVHSTTLLYSLLLVFDLKPAVPPILGVTWSLPPEIYMYVLLPALFAYARAVKKVWPLLVVWLLVVCCDNHFFPDRAIGNNFPILVPDFLAGIIAYVGFLRRRPLLPAWTLPLLLGVGFGFYMMLPQIRADWYACLAIALVLPGIREFEVKPLAWLTSTVARYSYGVYLFHPFSLVLGMYLLVGRSLAVQLTVEFLSLAVFAFVGYHTIEAPLIRLGARVAAKLAGEKGLPSETSLETLEPAP